MDAYEKVTNEETFYGRIVLSIGCDLRNHMFDTYTAEHKEEIKKGLDELHKRKIDLADEILVLNVGGYVGESTLSEIAYAAEHGKAVRWLELDSAQSIIGAVMKLKDNSKATKVQGGSRTAIHKAVI
jgi:hypothetical protein